MDMKSKISFLKRIIAALLITSFLQACPLILIGGTGGIALLVHERRTAGTLADDKEIQLKIYRLLKKKVPKSSDIVVVAYNRRVLLAGEAPDQKTKLLANTIARELVNVREIINEIELKKSRTSKARTKDTLTTGKVKTALLKNKISLLNHVKVITIGNTVYLMGIVTIDEGKISIEQARRVNTVKKVVQVFEYKS